MAENEFEIINQQLDGKPEFYMVVGVKFNSTGKSYYFDPGDLVLDINDRVIVETAHGLEFGYISYTNTKVSASEVTPPLRQVVRLATEEDIKIDEENKKKEIEAGEIFTKRVVEHNLNMKLIDVVYTFDNQKLLFYYTAEGRIDFRELVRDLATIFRTRIELRQIGIRDETKLLGGLGVCGRPFCCKKFLNDFEQVSIKMAKEQNLSLNSQKISGACGRLMCCLRYEHEAYESELAKMPKIDSKVIIPNGTVGTVTEISPLTGIVKVKLYSGEDEEIKIFLRDELKPAEPIVNDSVETEQDLIIEE